MHWLSWNAFETEFSSIELSLSLSLSLSQLKITKSIAGRLFHSLFSHSGPPPLTSHEKTTWDLSEEQLRSTLNSLLFFLALAISLSFSLVSLSLSLFSLPPPRLFTSVSEVVSSGPMPMSRLTRWASGHSLASAWFYALRVTQWADQSSCLASHEMTWGILWFIHPSVNSFTCILHHPCCTLQASAFSLSISLSPSLLLHVRATISLFKWQIRWWWACKVFPRSLAQPEHSKDARVDASVFSCSHSRGIHVAAGDGDSTFICGLGRKK